MCMYVFQVPTKFYMPIYNVSLFIGIQPTATVIFFYTVCILLL